METLTIRPAAAADVPTLLDFMHEFNAFEGIPYSPARVEPALRALLADGAVGFVRVAEQAGIPVGYVVVTFGYDLEFAGRDAFVTELFVARSHRRLGIAGRMLEVAEHDARSRDVRALHLVVRPDNPNAIALYASVGFETSPRRVMTKTL